MTDTTPTPEPDVHALDVGDAFEGQTILGSAIELPSLAGGLREASKVNGGQIIPKGARRFILIEVVGNKTRFQPVKDTEGCTRVDIPAVEGLTFVGGQTFERAMARHKKEAQRLALEEERQRAEERGQSDLGTVEGEDFDGVPPDTDPDAVDPDDAL